MYVHSVKLVNYKSFGEKEDNEVILEPGVTAIIGMNESGKSNVLSGLSHVDPHFRRADGFKAELRNRNILEETNIKYQLVLKPTQSDIEQGLIGDTAIEMYQNSEVATGGFVNYINKYLNPELEKVVSILVPMGSNPLRLDGTDYNFYKCYLTDWVDTDSVDIPLRSNSFRFVVKHIDRFNSDDKEELRQCLQTLEGKWSSLLQMVPSVFFRNGDKYLKSFYTEEEVSKQLNSPNSYPDSLLPDFVRLIGFKFDDFIMASKSGAGPLQIRERDRIKRAINKQINVKFNDFYKTEEVSMGIEFNGGRITFTVQSGDSEMLLLNERSNGLRWYFDTFIDAQANNVPNQNVVYLFDEPGVYLHVNAQKELLKLFNHLAAQGNQVVYTTHSPYMLDTEEGGLHRIRAVVKDQEGYSHIYKTVYDSRIVPDSQHDTLAPVIQAIGMNLCDTFGPAKNKINIITEGASDYIYLKTMAKVLGIDSNCYAIIPSVGATNSVNICSILQGWGCPYIALFDYDPEGVRNGELLREKMDCKLGEQYCFVQNVTQDEIDSKTYKEKAYMIEDVVTREEIEKFCDAQGVSKEYNKSLIAKLFANAVEKEDYECGEQSKRNFEDLFERILKSFEQVSSN